ncbi:Inositol phosphatase SIW14 [Friedmanniomyces endolithicus]|uniref:ER membrane protein complex subunit 2 n=1 Tax=Friedmanniomyces endolithicus TaxID=329885 RepID=A0AAN6JW29_9PEZI|nr:Inositol phosphatase SIW14 [Friedmanniomyces endolithicus]KAK0870597.1 Inositol phosphatase SIW14 [Friedmanniomyces endolithicus]KAK0878530.1 Inositol phosphatase SIW14 [Friedmanniomyces endolithicus]KAK0892777.1 Inositol phosphatase SIW14 [Friedmanniomyces endolithicus]KAK0906439.1 Inositol phosphatase SIW14 [Friedmanniomyces endolithicus]
MVHLILFRFRVGIGGGGGDAVVGPARRSFEVPASLSINLRTHDQEHHECDSETHQPSQPAKMPALYLTAPISADPRLALSLAAQAPTFTTSQASSWWSSLPYPLTLFLNSESQEKWTSYENLFLACLRTGDFTTAYTCLEALIARFGKTNDHILALQGLYQEATAQNTGQLEEVMKAYDEVLREDPTIFSVRKRRAALLRSVGKAAEAIADLTVLVDASPTDAEAWAELADLCLGQGSLEQAVYCLEEVLLVMPNAWNMHARLGEVVYMSAQKMEGGDQMKALAESMRRFCRSIELCDGYLRGFYGLRVTTGTLLEALQGAKKGQPTTSDPLAGDLAPPSVATVMKLNELATAKLAEIVRRGTAGEKGWDGYSEVELKAAKDLIDRDTQKIER